MNQRHDGAPKTDVMHTLQTEDGHVCTEQNPTRSQLGIKGRAKLLVYLNHFITGWDNSIWAFALGLFLVEITPESLTFTASYGLVAGGTVLVFGPLVGYWVDRTARLTVARISVLVNNIALILCSLLVFVVIQYKSFITTVWPNEALLKVCNAGIITIAIVANLTNMARTTAIERDWIVEICEKDKDMLATLSATMRRISLFTMVLAPIVTGQLLGLTSHAIGAIAVAGWNFMTIFLEYFLLWKIYKEVPQLQRTKTAATANTMEITKMQGLDMANEFTDIAAEKSDSQYGRLDVAEEERPRRCVASLFSSCITLHKGWGIYKSYDVFFAGLSLSFLYLTVLGVDGITIGFVISQGLSEGLVGGLYAIAAGTGIIGTILYPYVRKKVGLKRTGLYALAAEIASLTLCVVSIWCPGSPFEPNYFSRSHDSAGDLMRRSNDSDVTTTPVSSESYALDTSLTTGNTTLEAMTASPELTSYISISLLMAGIIGARVGLWMSDLTITQLFLETVHVSQRGIVSGVQNALNQLMDMFKFALVILLPVPEVFGYLVMISFCFICLSWVLFAVYVKHARRYVLPDCTPELPEDKKSSTPSSVTDTLKYCN